MFHKLGDISNPIYRLAIESLISFLTSLCVGTISAHWVNGKKQ